MMDLYDRYLKGIGDLLQAIEPTDADYLTVLTLQGRLAQAISEIRQYGPTDSARAEIARVTTELDRLCLAHIDRSFRALCGIDRLPKVGPPEIYQNLPQPDYGQFVGREQELARIYELLSPTNRHFLVTIDGIGGIGKSALALEVAHHYLHDAAALSESERFDAIIWTSAKQTVLTAKGQIQRKRILRTLSDIYATISITLEREDIIRSRPEEQPELVRRALTQQRTLLVVDNLETVDDEDVLTFLRELPAPTKAIVTTRHRLDVAYPVRLTGMPWGDAQALIAQECEKKGVALTDEQTRRLYNRTGGVPLALVWSIAQMGFGYGVDTVLHRLGQPSSDIARFCFESTISQLNEATYNVLIALALCDQDTGANRESLGEILNLSVADRDEILAKLEVLSLVNKYQGRFRLLPLTRTYLLNRLDSRPDLRQKIAEIWAEYFQRKTETIEGEYYWQWAPQTFRALVDDGPNILIFLEWAYEHGAARQIFALTKGGCWYLAWVGRWGDEVSYARRAADLAKSTRNHKAAARNLGIAGWIFTQWGDLQQAEQVFNEALELYRRGESREGECLALQWLGMVPRKRGQFEQAADLYEQAWHIACELDSGDLQALVNMERGKLARDMRDWSSARDYFIKVREWFETKAETDPRDAPLSAGAWGQLATVESALGNYEAAREQFLKSLDLYQVGASQGFQSTMELRLARVELALDHIEIALEYARDAAYWFERLGMKPDLEEAQEFLKQLGAGTSEQGDSMNNAPNDIAPSAALCP